MAELRRHRIAVTVGDVLAFRSWAEGESESVAGFTMSFSMTRNSKGEPSKGSVVITNPPEAQALELVTARRPPLIRVLFGWEAGGMSLVGGGNAEKDGVKLSHSGVDSALSISFIDGIAALRGSYVAVKVPAGARASEVVAAVIAKSGLPAGVVDIAPEDDYVLPRSYTADGNLREVLGRLGKALRSTPSIVDGKVQFLANSRTLPNQGPLFSTANGTLVAKPEPRGRDGAMFRVVLDPSLRTGSRFRIDYPGLFGTGTWKAQDTKATAGSYEAALMTIEAVRSK